MKSLFGKPVPAVEPVVPEAPIAPAEPHFDASKAGDLNALVAAAGQEEFLAIMADKRAEVTVAINTALNVTEPGAASEVVGEVSDLVAAVMRNKTLLEKVQNGALRAALANVVGSLMTTIEELDKLPQFDGWKPADEEPGGTL